MRKLGGLCEDDRRRFCDYHNGAWSVPYYLSAHTNLWIHIHVFPRYVGNLWFFCDFVIFLWKFTKNLGLDFVNIHKKVTKKSQKNYKKFTYLRVGIRSFVLDDKSNFSESACLHRLCRRSQIIFVVDLRRRYVGIIIVDIIFVYHRCSSSLI